MTIYFTMKARRSNWISIVALAALLTSCGLNTQGAKSIDEGELTVEVSEISATGAALNFTVGVSSFSAEVTQFRWDKLTVVAPDGRRYPVSIPPGGKPSEPIEAEGALKSASIVALNQTPGHYTFYYNDLTVGELDLL